MNAQARRYIFIDYENLLQVKFKKLEKVASKIFVFVKASQETVPLSLVNQVQRAGKSLRWIVVHEPTSSKLNYQIAFIMGSLHQKLVNDVEFAVVSHDPEFDPLITFINDSGRRCVRVKRKKDDVGFYPESAHHNDHHFDEDYSTSSFTDDDGDIPVLVDDEMIVRTAEETVKRLIRSGNRPAEISALKEYISLNSQELALHGNADRIIQKMEESKDIEVKKGKITYNF